MVNIYHHYWRILLKYFETKLPGVIVIEPRVFPDNRGFFLESFRVNAYEEIGIEQKFFQENLSRSFKDVLRGLHYQLKHPQGKLVTVTHGKVFDVIVDISPTSPTFKQFHYEVLSDENHKQIYIPPGYAHGFYTISDTADFFYKCTNYYVPGDEYGVKWDDQDLLIPWPIAKTPIISDKDQVFKNLKEIDRKFLP
jgi:dTDP-4-dehydrorhamnose 3,5-epimerase